MAFLEIMVTLFYNQQNFSTSTFFVFSLMHFFRSGDFYQDQPQHPLIYDKAQTTLQNQDKTFKKQKPTTTSRKNLKQTPDKKLSRSRSRHPFKHFHSHSFILLHNPSLIKYILSINKVREYFLEREWLYIFVC